MLTAIDRRGAWPRGLARHLAKSRRRLARHSANKAGKEEKEEEKEKEEEEEKEEEDEFMMSSSKI